MLAWATDTNERIFNVILCLDHSEPYQLVPEMMLLLVSPAINCQMNQYNSRHIEQDASQNAWRFGKVDLYAFLNGYLDWKEVLFRGVACELVGFQHAGVYDS